MLRQVAPVGLRFNLLKTSGCMNDFCDQELKKHLMQVESESWTLVLSLSNAVGKAIPPLLAMVVVLTLTLLTELLGCSKEAVVCSVGLSVSLSGQELTVSSERENCFCRN